MIPLQLASIRAVPGDFPFYGKLELTPQRAPAPGEIWLSARVMQLLGAKVGGTRGRQHPADGGRGAGPGAGSGVQPFQMAPRALIHSADIEATGALLPGSRQQWRYLVKGPRDAIARYEAWLNPRLSAGQKLVKPDDQGTQVGKSLGNAERFFRLASLAGVLLGALAMGIAVRHFAERQTNMVALLKTLGASRRTLWQLMGTLLFSLTLVGALMGLVAGSAMQWLTLNLLGICCLRICRPLLATLRPGPRGRLLHHPDAGVRPLPEAAQGTAAAGAAPGAGGGDPPWLTVPVGLIGLFALVWGFTADIRLACGLIGGMGVLMALLALLASVLLRLGSRLKGPHALRLAINHLSRERGSGLFQLAGFALALMLFGLLWAARVDLLEDFSTRLPADAPNRFLVNVADSEREGILADLHQAGAITSDFYPMVRGRLTRIAGEAVGRMRRGRGGQRAQLHHHIGPARRQQGHCRSMAGRQGEVSVDEALAGRLGIALGDVLGFTIEGRAFEARVTSLRSIKWDNMRPNFYMIFSPDVLAPSPRPGSAAIVCRLRGEGQRWNSSAATPR